ncbi:MAG: TonB-dependent receptor plug domain-containing protein, partial [Gemmatimonadaceae bacterium]
VADTIVLKTGDRDSLVFARSFAKDTAGIGAQIRILEKETPAGDRVSSGVRTLQKSVNAEKSATAVGPMMIVDGVVQETGRKSATAADPIIIVDGVIQESGNPNKDVRSNGTLGVKGVSAAGEPLLIIDGVEVDSRKFNRLNRETISAVEVIKGEAARRIYGDRAVNGVILITTKK